ncbi:MAG: hypothetical protein ACRBEE_12390 [Arenicella sp.]
MSLFKTEIVKKQLNKLFANLKNLNTNKLKVFIFKNFNTIITIITLFLVWQTFEITKAQFHNQQADSFEEKKLKHLNLLQGQMVVIRGRLHSIDNAIRIYENLNDHGKRLHKQSCKPISVHHEQRDKLNSIKGEGLKVFNEIRNLEYNSESVQILDSHVKNTPAIMLINDKILSEQLNYISIIDPCIETARRLSKSPL